MGGGRILLLTGELVQQLEAAAAAATAARQAVVAVAAAVAPRTRTREPCRRTELVTGGSARQPPCTPLGEAAVAAEATYQLAIGGGMVSYDPTT